MVVVEEDGLKFKIKGEEGGGYFIFLFVFSVKDKLFSNNI